MNIKEFLVELKKTKSMFDWTADQTNIDGSIKNKKLKNKFKIRTNLFCPITAVCFKNKKILYNIDQYITAAIELGIRLGTAQKIATCSDYTKALCVSLNIEYSSRLRKQMLNALGLKDEE